MSRSHAIECVGVVSVLVGALTVLVAAGYGLVVDPPGVAPLVLRLCLLSAAFGAAAATVGLLGTIGRLPAVDPTRTVVAAIGFVAGSVLLVNLPATSLDPIRAAPGLATAAVTVAGSLSLGVVVASKTPT